MTEHWICPHGYETGFFPVPGAEWQAEINEQTLAAYEKEAARRLS